MVSQILLAGTICLKGTKMSPSTLLVSKLLFQMEKIPLPIKCGLFMDCFMVHCIPLWLSLYQRRRVQTCKDYPKASFRKGRVTHKAKFTLNKCAPARDCKLCQRSSSIDNLDTSNRSWNLPRASVYERSWASVQISLQVRPYIR